MAWSPRTKFGLVAGIFIAVLIVLAAAIWLLYYRPLAAAGLSVRDLVHVTRTPLAQADQALNTELEKMKAAGEPLTIEEIMPPEVPDAENAAPLYQQAFTLLDLSQADEDAWSELHNSISHPRKAKTASVATLEQIVGKNAPAIKLLAAAAQRPRCAFPVDWSAGFRAQFDHLTKLRTCAKLLALKIAMHAIQEETAEALDTAQVSLAMSKPLQREPRIVSQITAYAIQSITLLPLQQALIEHSAPTSACRKLFDYLQQMNLNEALLHTLWGERALAIRAFDEIQDHPDKAIWLIGNDVQTVRQAYNSVLGPKIFALDKASYLRLMSELIPELSKPWRESVQTRELLERGIETVPRYCIMNAVVAPPYVSVFARCAGKRDVATAQVRLAQAALALKAYKNKRGKYPVSLEELHKIIPWELREDPFSGQAFVYKREGDGFLIYSVGLDLKDNAGHAWDYVMGGGRDRASTGDIVWRCKK